MRLRIRDNIRTHLWFGVYCHVSLWHLSYRRSISGCKYFVIPLDIVKFIVTVSSVGVSLQRISRRSREAGLNFSYVSFLFFYVVYLFFSEGKNSESNGILTFKKRLAFLLYFVREFNESNASVEYELIDLGFDTQVTCNFNHQQQNKYFHFSLSLNKQSQVKFDSVANGEKPQFNQFKLHKQRARTFTTFLLYYIFSLLLGSDLLIFFPVLNVTRVFSSFLIHCFCTSFRSKFSRLHNKNSEDHSQLRSRFLHKSHHHISLLLSFKKIISVCGLS